MKQTFKLIIITIFILISIIMIDTLQALIFKNSPIISWYNTQPDKDSYVDRGIIVDTYYCTKEKDIVTINHYLKNTKFTCPIDNEKMINQNSSDNFNINIKETEDCTNTLTKYYEQKEHKIYLSCLDEVYLKSENIKENTLNYYLQNTNKTFDEVIKNLVKNIDNVDYYSDGGTKIYKKDNFTILVCNTLDGNKDIYIGNKDLRYKSNYCKENNTTFTKTYTINKVENYTKQQYENDIPVTYSKSLEVTLNLFQGETKTVIINNPVSEIKENKTYEFEFMLNEDKPNIEDTIESIFKDTIIVDIIETDKLGLSQRQDEIK